MFRLTLKHILIAVSALAFLAVMAPDADAARKKPKKTKVKKPKKNGGPVANTAVPELDPNTLGAALLMLFGGVLIVVGREKQAPLGAILVRTGLRKNDLREALDAQRNTGSPLGETLLSMGAIDQSELDFALAIQGERLKESPRLGDILTNTIGMEPALLDEALAKQEQSGALLGDVLLEMGAVTEYQLARALSQQLLWSNEDVALALAG